MPRLLIPKGRWWLGETLAWSPVVCPCLRTVHFRRKSLRMGRALNAVLPCRLAGWDTLGAYVLHWEAIWVVVRVLQRVSGLFIWWNNACQEDLKTDI